MACKRCGGNRKNYTNDLPVFQVVDRGGEMTKISTRSTILLQGIQTDSLKFRVGKILKISATAAADLLTKGAPIWILT